MCHRNAACFRSLHGVNYARKAPSLRAGWYVNLETALPVNRGQTRFIIPPRFAGPQAVTQSVCLAAVRP